MLKSFPIVITALIATLFGLGNIVNSYAASNPSLSYIAKNSKINNADPINYFAVLDTTENKLQHYKGDTVPSSLASVVKVIVALGVLDDVINNKYSLTTSTSRPYTTYADGGYGKNVLENLKFMLGPSSNNATNILINRVGGFASLNAKVKKYGLNKTTIACMLSPVSINSSTCTDKNRSTMRDLITAMNEIRKSTLPVAVEMKRIMTQTKYTYNHTARMYNKCGLNSKSLGDVGVFQITKDGVTTEYVYAAIVDFPNGSGHSGGYYDSRTEPLAGKVPTTDLKEKRDPISKGLQWLENDLQAGYKVAQGEL
jgi:hypothetical protein